MKHLRKITILCTACLTLCCTALLAGCTSKEAQEVQKQIDALPDSYSDSVDDSLAEVHAAYDKLSADDKKDVKTSKMDQLDSEQQAAREAEEALKQSAEEVNQKIKELKIDSQTLQTFSDSTKKIDEITKLLKDLPEEAHQYVDYETLSEKMGAEDSFEFSEVYNRQKSRLETANDEYLAGLRDMGKFVKVTIYSSDEITAFLNSARKHFSNAASELSNINVFDVSSYRSKMQKVRDNANTGGSVIEISQRVSSVGDLTDDITAAHKNCTDYGEKVKDALEEQAAALERLMAVIPS
ncbi:MAG: hypothetical protein IJ060_11620 [Oscillospiraceae bacterium]|nr:hypothetical protein [Oscillospiraceae bacterium]